MSAGFIPTKRIGGIQAVIPLRGKPINVLNMNLCAKLVEGVPSCRNTLTHSDINKMCDATLYMFCILDQFGTCDWTGLPIARKEFVRRMKRQYFAQHPRHSRRRWSYARARRFYCKKWREENLGTYIGSLVHCLTMPVLPFESFTHHIPYSIKLDNIKEKIK